LVLFVLGVLLISSSSLANEDVVEIDDATSSSLMDDMPTIMPINDDDDGEDGVVFSVVAIDENDDNENENENENEDEMLKISTPDSSTEDDNDDVDQVRNVHHVDLEREFSVNSEFEYEDNDNDTNTININDDDDDDDEEEEEDNEAVSTDEEPRTPIRVVEDAVNVSDNGENLANDTENSICVVHGIINNTTPYNMTLVSADLQYGMWKQSAPTFIRGKSVGTFEADSEFFDLVGVQGALIYQFYGVSGFSTMSFYNPYIGFDKWDISVPPGIDGQYTSAAGYDATVTYILTSQ